MNLNYTLTAFLNRFVFCVLCFRFLNAQPLPIKLGILRPIKKRQKRDEDAPVDNQNAVEAPSSEGGSGVDSSGLVGILNQRASSDPINCNWNIQVKR